MSTLFSLPKPFARNIITFHGEEQGTAWLQQLPAILSTCEQQWQVKISSPFAQLSLHYVATATDSRGTPLVVKIMSTTNEFTHESEALRLFAGRGIAQRIDSIDEYHAMLLERLQPGQPLSQLADDEQATIYAAHVMKQLWRPAPEVHRFPTVFDWQQGYARLRKQYQGGHGPFAPALLDEGETLYKELSSSMGEQVLLHGDLHHDNILKATRAPWLAIDPKGLVGEPAYETGAFLHNPLPRLLQQPDPRKILKRRIDIFADELGIARQRIRDWAVAQAVLAVWWMIEDTGSFEPAFMECAHILASIHY